MFENNGNMGTEAKERNGDRDEKGMDSVQGRV